MEMEAFKIYTKKMAKDLHESIAKFEIKSIDSSNGTFKVIASDETMDRQGEILKANGCNFENYMKNPIMLFGHDYRSIENIVGKANRAYVENNQVILEGVFASTESAQMVRTLYDEGILKTVSVGLRVLSRNMEDSDIVETWELLECSFVPVPANPNALDARMYADCLTKGLITKKEDEEEDKEKGTAKVSTIDDVMTLLGTISTKIDTLPDIILEKFNEAEAQDADDNADGNMDNGKSVKLQETKENLQRVSKIISDTLHKIKL